MSYIDALNRISQIQGQLEALETGSPATSSGASTGAASSATSSGSSFATQLAQAQAVTPTTSSALAATPDALSTTAAGELPTTAASELPTGTLATGVPITATGTPVAGAAPASLPGAGSLTSAQQQFAARLAADTGLNQGVVDAWLLAEESGGAATARQSANNNDWLNIGYTDSATYGGSDSVWSDPVAAADATAGWLQGKDTIPGYGTASGGVQAILQTAGQSPATQIAAIQGSGWASSGYPDLPGLFQQVTGQ